MSNIENALEELAQTNYIGEAFAPSEYTFGSTKAAKALAKVFPNCKWVYMVLGDTIAVAYKDQLLFIEGVLNKSQAIIEKACWQIKGEVSENFKNR